MRRKSFCLTCVGWMMCNVEALSDEIAVTEERSSMLDLMKKRLNIGHTISLHRDSVSVSDVKAMLAHLERAGMPLTATLTVNSNVNGTGHLHIFARWSEDLNGGVVSDE